MKFSLNFEVLDADIDAHDHVNNVTYLQWIQDVAVGHWQHLASAEQQATLTWFVLRHEIDYRGRAFLGDSIKAETWVGEASRVKCERFTKITRDAEVLVQAKSIWCLFSTATERPTRVTDDLRAVFNMQ